MQWIINNLYINNQLSIPDVFNRLSIDVQWNINYYWTILVTDSKGKLLPRLSKHHQWTNLQLGVWSQRCSMLMHCPSMQVKSPSLVFVCLLLSSDRVFMSVCYYHLTESFLIRRKGDLQVVSFTVDISSPHLSSFTPEKFTLSTMTKTISKNNKLGKE